MLCWVEVVSLWLGAGVRVGLGAGWGWAWGGGGAQRQKCISVRRYLVTTSFLLRGSGRQGCGWGWGEGVGQGKNELVADTTSFLLGEAAGRGGGGVGGRGGQTQQRISFRR